MKIKTKPIGYPNKDINRIFLEWCNKFRFAIIAYNLQEETDNDDKLSYKLTVYIKNTPCSIMPSYETFKALENLVESTVGHKCMVETKIIPGAFINAEIGKNNWNINIIYKGEIIQVYNIKKVIVPQVGSDILIRNGIYRVKNVGYQYDAKCVYVSVTDIK